MKAVIAAIMVLSLQTVLCAQQTLPWQPVILEQVDSSVTLGRVFNINGVIYATGGSMLNQLPSPYPSGCILRCDSNLENCFTNYVEQNLYNRRFVYVDMVKWDNKLVAFVQAQDSALTSPFVLNYFNESTLALDSMYEVPSEALNNKGLRPYKALVTSNNEALVAGFCFRTNTVDGSAYGFVMCMGANREAKWITEFNTSGSSGQVFEVKKYKDSYIVVGNENQNIFVARIDTLGNVLWNKLFTSLNPFPSLLVDEDKNLIYIGGRDEGEFTGATLMHYPRLLVLDTNGVGLWSKTYTNIRRYQGNAFVKLAFSEDSNIIAMANPQIDGVYFGHSGYGVQTLIMKIDKSNGDVLYNRCYQIGQQQFYNTMTDSYDMLTTSDGSIFIGGAFTWGNDSGSIMGFMQKLNSEGCPGVPCNCELGWLSDEEVQLNKQEVKVFPNPAENWITITGGENGRKNYRITSLDGKLVLEGTLPSGNTESRIDLQNISSGVYLITLVEEKGASFTHKIVIK